LCDNGCSSSEQSHIAFSSSNAKQNLRLPLLWWFPRSTSASSRYAQPVQYWYHSAQQPSKSSNLARARTVPSRPQEHSKNSTSTKERNSSTAFLILKSEQRQLLLTPKLSIAFLRLNAVSERFAGTDVAVSIQFVYRTRGSRGTTDHNKIPLLACFDRTLDSLADSLPSQGNCPRGLRLTGPHPDTRATCKCVTFGMVLTSLS
jgi:hypothetical protein